MSDDNMDEDIDDVFDSDESGFDDFSKQGTLGDMWRNNPLVKIGVIFGAFAIIVGGILIFGGSGKKGPPSRLTSGSDVSEPPATSEVSESYRKAVEEENVERVEQALRENKSALPTPLDPPKGIVPLAEEEKPEEDPLERWRRLQEARRRKVELPEKLSKEKQPGVDPRGAAVDALSKRMADQMASILEAQAPQPPAIKTITNMKWLASIENGDGGIAGTGDGDGDGAGNADEATVEILIEEGSIIYGQLLIEANTDAPGPVLAQIVTGPYAGSRMLGSFEATDNYLILSFNSIVIDGMGHETQAVAIDPDTTLPGVVTEIDRRYFKRIILPMAAEFVRGLSEAVSESGSTTITIDSGGTTTSQTNEDKDEEQEVASGIEAAGEKFGELIEEEAQNTKPMIRVAAGTPLGILFVEPVTEELAE